MFQMTPSLADIIYSWANIALVVGGIVTLVATVVTIQITGVRDRYSDERISANEALAAQANLDASEARQRTADIESENIKLQTRLEEERTSRLALEQKVNPRRLTSEQKDRLVASLKPYQGQEVRVISPPNTESNEYALDFIDVFRMAGWEVMESETSTGVSTVGYDIEPSGIQLGISPDEPPSAQVRRSIEALAKVLVQERLRESTDLGLPVHDRKPELLEFGVGGKPTVDSAEEQRNR